MFTIIRIKWGFFSTGTYLMNTIPMNIVLLITSVSTVFKCHRQLSGSGCHPMILTPESRDRPTHRQYK